MESQKRVSIHGGHSGEFCSHATDMLEDIIVAYAEKGFHWVGITEHIPPIEDRFLYPEETKAGFISSTLYHRFERYIVSCRQLQRKYADLGFTVFGVNVEQDRASADRVLRDIPVTFPILFDDENTVSEQYGVDAMPMTLLLDRNGVIRHLHRGYKPGYEDKYEEQVRSLVRE